MTLLDIYSKIEEILELNFSIDKDDISMYSSITDDLALDSLEFVELIMYTEEEFHIEIPDNVCERIRIVRDLVEAVVKCK